MPRANVRGALEATVMSPTEPAPAARPPAPAKPRTGRLDEVLGDGPDPGDSDDQQPAVQLLLPRRTVG